MPPKQKSDTAGYQQMKKDLSAGNPGQLYIFHGEETYLRDHYLGRLKELLLSGGMELTLSKKAGDGVTLAAAKRCDIEPAETGEK